MPNYKLTIQYEGTRYKGWQEQKHTEATIQGKLQRVLERMTEEEIDLQGSGRTDAGVHAKGQIAHFHTKAVWDVEEIKKYMNEYLPEDIAKNFRFEDMMASKSVLDPTKTFEMALNASGYKGDIKNRLNPEEYKAMFELHIEQGPILEAAGNDIGVVTCVLGMVNYRIRTYGQADHAGTTPMKYRKDALFAAAKVLEYLHEELDLSLIHISEPTRP